MKIIIWCLAFGFLTFSSLSHNRLATQEPVPRSTEMQRTPKTKVPREDERLTQPKRKRKVQVVAMKCKDATSCGQDDITLEQARAQFKRPSTGFHVATDHNICNSDRATGHYYYWAPVEHFVNGENALQSLISRAETGQVFNKYQVLDSAEGPNQERHLALCNVTQIEGVVGPPVNCATVAIISPSGTWLRGGEDTRQCLTAFSPRLTGAININFSVVSQAGPELFAKELVNVLRSDLELSVEENPRTNEEGNVEEVFVSSTVGPRNSKILSAGWREALDFDVNLYRIQGKLEIKGVAHAVVCREALGSISYYQGLDESQQAAYGAALNARVNEAIKRVCPNYAQSDDKTISSCD